MRITTLAQGTQPPSAGLIKQQPSGMFNTADGLPDQAGREAEGAFKYISGAQKALPIILVLALFAAAMFAIGDLLYHAQPLAQTRN